MEFSCDVSIVHDGESRRTDDLLFGNDALLFGKT